ncbi:hypothetical protein FACS1894184_16330 [Clostridia bacterium]|nr:hypothetical protein FACS1894184_16330 [Clostridia bacterium]
MADQIHTRESLENVFWLAVAACLNLDPDAQETQSRIRISWPVESENGSNPGWGRDEDICFMRITEDITDQFGRLRDAFWEHDAETDVMTEYIKFTRVHTLHLIFYGPHSFDDAERVRVWMFREGVRRILRTNRLFPIPHNQRPMRVPELEGGVWWDRSDIQLTINECVCLEYNWDYINEARATIPASV